ncbi:MAG TPA: GGDEF domain-containing protein [Phycisphaerae bacterium]|nr:GGDEF domain-containing protein [Phycisphaerae bacterium]HOJ74098.1 GGDEF domain-containing protein [Phycisphaerae bacterium]HOM50692.1 GGDEF domain-containing protein [Phycisphaerae bacterium]HON67878.1 GGDEF domain-containing protein [Phycisphaerae bacterium]HOQ85114.1 GGDEF domain-containing protein [Phycisphaerae bacterium]
MIPRDLGLLARERLLVVHDPADLARMVRNRYPQFDVISSDSYMSGIAALAGEPVRGVLVGVDPAARKLDQAIAGLRKAAGNSSRLVLCCLPSGEPLARQVVSAGADDYLIYPPLGRELDCALALPAAGELAVDSAAGEALPSWEELVSLADALSELGGGRRPLLERLCRMIAQSMRVTSVRILVKDDTVYVGDPKTEPALAEPIVSQGRPVGKILVGPRQRAPFSVGEVEKIRHYGRLIAHLLEAADRQQQWQNLAMIDEVSGLPNRRYLLKALEELLRRANTERFRVTVLFFDLDGFKHFNDTYGHSAGDAVVRETAQLLRKHCRKDDIVARYAGDEFVVVFWDAEEPRVSGSKHPTDVLMVLRRFRKALESHEFGKLGPEAIGHITISGGLASYPWDANTAEELIEKADRAMLEAKRAGKNRIYLVGSQEEA